MQVGFAVGTKVGINVGAGVGITVGLYVGSGKMMSQASADNVHKMLNINQLKERIFMVFLLCYFLLCERWGESSLLRIKH